jgi:hypothetical protein
MISTIYKECASGITYYGASLKPEYFVSHDEINQMFHSGAQEKVYSLHVYHLTRISLRSPERVYHLASIIRKKFPEMHWNWAEQLFDMESEIRCSKYKGQYFEKTGYTSMMHFDSDHAAMYWEFELHLFLKQKEPDLLLTQKVAAGILLSQ